MPVAKLRGADINYEVLGTHGPWLALSPGGRRALELVRPLAERMSDAGYRVLIHDRRNCGLSDIVIGGETSEYEIWADDLYELLSRLNALPAVPRRRLVRLPAFAPVRAEISPRGVRSAALARHRRALSPPSASPKTITAKYIRAAQHGGMAAVCELDHFKERIAARPSNRETLMAMDPNDFIAAMERWREQFRRAAALPVIGTSEKDLNSIRVPTCIIPGNDRTHNHAIAETAHRMIPASELHDLFPGRPRR